MLRAAQLSTSRATQPMVNILSKRFQQTSTSSSSSSTPSPSASPSTARPTSTSTTGTGSTQFVSATKDSSTATKTQTTSSPASSSSTTTGGTTKKSTSAGVPPSLPPRSNVPPGSSGGGNAGSYIKTGALGLGIGLGIGLLYSEYENDKFRRKFENMVPLSSTILGGLDKVIDPVFGRKKSLTTQAVNAANKAYDQLPEYKTVKGAVTGAAEQAKDLANKAYDQLPDSKTVKKNLSSAKEQMDDAAKSVQKGISTTKDQMDDAAKSVQKGISTVKDQAADVKKRLTKGKSGAGLNDPMFEEEPGEAGDLVPPAVPKDKLKSTTTTSSTPISTSPGIGKDSSHVATSADHPHSPSSSHHDDHGHGHGHGHGHHEPELRKTKDWGFHFGQNSPYEHQGEDPNLIFTHQLPHMPEYRGAWGDVPRWVPYRTRVTTYSLKDFHMALFLSFVVWTYIIHRFYMEPYYFFGHVKVPDTSKWTDEELGIPPDDLD